MLKIPPNSAPLLLCTGCDVASNMKIKFSCMFE